MSMKKTLTYIGRDDWSRPMYQDDDGAIWVDVEPRADQGPKLCTITDAGEPCDPMRADIEVTFFPCRDVWN